MLKIRGEKEFELDDIYEVNLKAFIKLMHKLLTIFPILTLLFFMILNNSDSMQQPAPFDHGHRIFNDLLKENVDDGKVDYKGFINSKEEFIKYLDSLGDVTEQQYLSWTSEQRLAFWINSYNAFTIKAIIDHYPIQRSFTLVGIFYAPKNSILQIPGVWKKLQFQAVGQNVTLDHIEHGILRKEFNEPRIHLAMNCASISCPDLRNEAYISDKIDKQLDDSSKNFVNSKTKGVLIDKNKNKIKVSKIFKWFGDDFFSNYHKQEFNDKSDKQNGTLGFIYKYINDDEKKYVLSGNYKLKYMSYDWGLNETKNN